MCIIATGRLRNMPSDGIYRSVFASHRYVDFLCQRGRVDQANVKTNDVVGAVVAVVAFVVVVEMMEI